MDRLEMMRKAVQLAKEQIDGIACLSDANYANLQELTDEKAVEKLAKEFLEDAAIEMDI